MTVSSGASAADMFTANACGVYSPLKTLSPSRRRDCHLMAPP